MKTSKTKSSRKTSGKASEKPTLSHFLLGKVKPCGTGKPKFPITVTRKSLMDMLRKATDYTEKSETFDRILEKNPLLLEHKEALTRHGNKARIMAHVKKLNKLIISSWEKSMPAGFIFSSKKEHDEWMEIVSAKFRDKFDYINKELIRHRKSLKLEGIEDLSPKQQ